MTGPAVIRAIVLALALAGCGRASGEDSPAGVLSRFVEAMERSMVDSAALEEAYGLLDAGAQQALQERAALAQNLAGQSFEPWELLAQGRFRLRLDPTAQLRAKVDGDRATVAVRGADGRQHADVPLVRQDGRWRIVLEIPPLRTSSPTSAESPHGERTR